MATWTVLTIVDPYGPDYIAAVAGRVDAFGHDLHTARVSASTADEAIRLVREAFHVVGPDRVTADDTTPHLADRWTVVGLASNGVCATHKVMAVIVGEHEVVGRRESALSHRWTKVVDAPTADDAEKAGYQAAAEQYADTWD
ncbi:hypothetical protein [Micromonospora carbonacea]|uniref:hypothetical protein n=1 Tax=Micromonospora carbonacea TaxID=47853 RepID=UPI00371717EF